MELINLKSQSLTMEESKDIINYIAQKRGISTKKLLPTIKPNLKRKNNKILTTRTQQKLTKTEQELIKSQKNLTKTQQELIKSQKNLTKTQQELIKSQKAQQNSLKLENRKNTQNLTYEKPSKVAKHENLTPQKRKNTQNLTYEKPSEVAKHENLTSQKQQILSKTKKRIETIREKLKELRHKLSKSELKEIKKHLYNIENKKELLELETTKQYLDELDKKFLKLDEYYDDDDFEFKGIENVQDLFKILTIDEYLASMLEIIYKPTLVKSGYDNNYIEYRSKGNEILTLGEYLALIEPYLRELINDYKNKGEWKIQLTAQINFISLRPGSNETRVMHIRSANEEFMNFCFCSSVIFFLYHFLASLYFCFCSSVILHCFLASLYFCFCSSVIL